MNFEQATPIGQWVMIKDVAKATNLSAEQITDLALCSNLIDWTASGWVRRHPMSKAQPPRKISKSDQ